MNVNVTIKGPTKDEFQLPRLPYFCLANLVSCPSATCCSNSGTSSSSTAPDRLHPPDELVESLMKQFLCGSAHTHRDRDTGNELTISFTVLYVLMNAPTTHLKVKKTNSPSATGTNQGEQVRKLTVMHARSFPPRSGIFPPPAWSLQDTNTKNAQDRTSHTPLDSKRKKKHKSEFT